MIHVQNIRFTKTDLEEGCLKVKNFTLGIKLFRLLTFKDLRIILNSFKFYDYSNRRNKIIIFWFVFTSSQCLNIHLHQHNHLLLPYQPPHNLFQVLPNPPLPHKIPPLPFLPQHTLNYSEVNACILLSEQILLPVHKSSLVVHEVKLVVQPCPRLSNGRGV